MFWASLLLSLLLLLYIAVAGFVVVFYVVVVGVVDAAAAAAVGVPHEGVKTVRLDLLLPSVTVANRTRRRQLALLRAATALRASPHRRARLSYPALLWLSALNCATFYLSLIHI